MTAAPGLRDKAPVYVGGDATMSSTTEQLHQHEWVVRDALDKETGIPGQWFACSLCGTYCT